MCLSGIERVCRIALCTTQSVNTARVTVTYDYVVNAVQASVVMPTFSAEDRISWREPAASLYIFTSSTVIVWQHGTV